MNPDAPHRADPAAAASQPGSEAPASDHLDRLSLRLDELVREGTPKGRLDTDGLDRGRLRALETRVTEVERELASATLALQRESGERARLEGLHRVAETQASTLRTNLQAERERVETARVRAERASRVEIETRIQVKELAAELDALRQISAVELESVKADLRRADQDLDDARARQAELDAYLSRSAADARELEADLDRVAASRAWRWGHAFMRLLKRLTFRRDKGASGLESAQKRARRLASGSTVNGR